MLNLVNILNEIVCQNIDEKQTKIFFEASSLELNNIFNKIKNEYDRSFKSNYIPKNNISSYYEEVKNTNKEQEPNK